MVWTEVGPAWREAFQLAWEGFLAGSPPVGAVVVGPDGSVVARGRSRRAEAGGPPNQLAGSRLAHAEVNALAQLPVDLHAGLRLLVTLEPCVLCAAAVATAHVPQVSFAGEDPMWRFVGDLRDFHPVLTQRWFTTDGPMTGPLGAWASLLPLIERLGRDPTGVRIDEYRATTPALFELAHTLIADGAVDDLRTRTLDDALGQIWPDLTEVASAQPAAPGV